MINVVYVFGHKESFDLEGRREKVSQGCEEDQIPNGWGDTLTQVVERKVPIYTGNEWYLTSFRITYNFRTPRVSKDDEFRLCGSHPDVIL